MQIRKKSLIALCVISCTLPPANADTLDAIKKFETCLATAARTLDDFTSPASDIASAAAAQCSPSWQAVLFANNEPLTRMDSYPSGAVRDGALRIVLEGRRDAIGQRNSSAPCEARRSNQKR